MIRQDTMARFYYNITSSKTIKVEKDVNGHKTVKIKGVTDIIENGQDINSYKGIQNGKKDWVFNILIIAAVIDLAALVVLMLFANLMDTNNKIFSLTSDYVASAGMLAPAYSFPRIRKLIGEKVFRFGKLGNKLYVTIWILIISFIVAAILFALGLTSKFANIISIVCLIIALKNMQ